MTNDTIDLSSHPASRIDAFWYWIIGKLGNFQAFIIEHWIKEPVWRSFDGRVNTPKTMTDRHLANTIDMINRTGETVPCFPALLREQTRRRELASVQADRFTAAFFEETEADKARRAEQLVLVTADYIPPGWLRAAVWHEGQKETQRLYVTSSGAKVELNRRGTWTWWRPHRHHITCSDPKITLEAALEAATED